MPVGSEAPERSDQYVLTNSVKSNLKDIARVVTARWAWMCILNVCLVFHYTVLHSHNCCTRAGSCNFLSLYRNHPVLLQGPTSAGKTSLAQWLAKATGHKCLRINNHEHTDLQEYVGMYTANSQGQLVFQEGEWFV